MLLPSIIFKVLKGPEIKKFRSTVWNCLGSWNPHSILLVFVVKCLTIVNWCFLENFKTVKKCIRYKNAKPQLNVVQRHHDTVKLSRFLLYSQFLQLSYCGYRAHRFLICFEGLCSRSCHQKQPFLHRGSIHALATASYSASLSPVTQLKIFDLTRLSVCFP